MDKRYDGSQFIEQDPSEEMGGKYLFDRRLKSYINNDNYLKIQTDGLWDSTPPTIRKRFSEVPADLDKSYGVQKNGNNYQLDDSTNRTFMLLNNYDELINDENTDLCFHNDNGVKFITLTMETATEEDNNTKGIGPWANTYTSNESWNVGFNPSKNYFLRPYFLSDPDHEEIPGVCRAQTFVAKTTGSLNSVNLRLGEGSDYGCDIILATCVQKTIKRGKAKTKGTMYYPPSMIEIKAHELDRIHVDRKLGKIEMRNFQFPKKPMVTAGEHYCFIVKSSLSPPSKSFRLGGWSDHCWKTKKPATIEKYREGDAFYSKDNGYNWSVHGIPDARLKYSQGKHPPILFNFECYIEAHQEQYVDKTQYLYSKPLHVNPVNSATLIIGCESNGGKYEYQIYDNVSGTWQNFVEGTDTIIYDGDEKPTFLILRVALTRGSDPVKSPIIYGLSLITQTERAKEGILRTPSYVPNTEGILATSMYSRVKALVKSDYKNTFAYVDIVRDTMTYESYSFIFFDDILDIYAGINPTQLEDIKTIASLPETTESEVESKTKIIHDYISNNPDLINNLYDHGFIICEELSMANSHAEYVKKGINLRGSAAYPIVSCRFVPTIFDQDKKVVLEKDLIVRSFMEFIHYDFDYYEDSLNFKKEMRDFIAEWGGVLEIRYNPCFVVDLLNNDMEHGFNLDVGTETRVVSNPPEDNVIGLRMDAVDPIREITITRKDIEEDSSPPQVREMELEEDNHFIVDYPNKTVYINNFQLQNKDIITVKYTPNLCDEKISLVYRMHRNDMNYNISVLPYWIETKT